MYIMHQSIWEEEIIADKIMGIYKRRVCMHRAQCGLYQFSGNLIILRNMNSTDSVMRTYSFSLVERYWRPA